MTDLLAEIAAVRQERDELSRLLDAEQKACGLSDAWYEMAERCDELGDLIGTLEQQERQTHCPILTSRDVANTET